MKYAKIIPHDVANGPGVRTSLFVSGCTNNCKGCFNKVAQNFDYGELFTNKTADEVIAHVNHPYSDGLSILGGDPLCQNKDGINALIELVLRASLRAGKTAWLWTGFVWEDIFNSPDTLKQSLVSVCDVVVDGPFVKEEKNSSLLWRGSSNQRIIDVQKTLQAGKIVLWRAYD